MNTRILRTNGLPEYETSERC
ncbi:MAG: hypothetical protein QOH74_177, partial [Gaiellales bacterium]|nr:hypothetical protein [Gaiellales bacterium]